MATQVTARRKPIVRGASLATLVVASVALAAPAAAQDDYPTKPITIIMPNNPGGATDRVARAMAPLLQEELGQPINVINKPGGGTLIGHAYLYAQPGDCYSFSYTALPYIVSNIENQNAPFTLDDFSWVNVQETASTVVFVPNGSPYADVSSLAEALKEPKKLSAAVIGGSSEHVGALLLMDALGLPRENLRLVTYDGGGTARTAIAGGQTDFALLPGQGSEPIADLVQPLAIYATKPVEGFDVPLINEALEPLGASVPVLPSSTRVFITHKNCETEHPERYAKFVDAYEKVVTSEAYQSVAREGALGRDWNGPEESQRIIDETVGMLRQYSDTISQ